MMRWLGQPFCEVCKMELARKLNNTDYVSKPAEIYVSNPEISIPHSKTGTLDRDSEKYRISEKNITKANNTDLEFRTVVQNLVNREQHLKMSFQIIGVDTRFRHSVIHTIRMRQENHFLLCFRMYMACQMVTDWMEKLSMRIREKCWQRTKRRSRNGAELTFIIR